MMELSRRSLVGCGLAFTASGLFGATPRKSFGLVERELRTIRESLGEGARLGVLAVDTGSERQISFDANARFAMCSTFKLPLAGFIFHLAETRRLSLSENLAFSAGDLLDNSPVTEANLSSGMLPIAELAAAAVRQSDNTAANLLLRKVGGPAALTHFIRRCGDRTTRIDRYELALNSNIDSDPRDTTTPAAMVGLVRTLVLGRVLSPASRMKLADWLITSVAKPDRLKAGFPRAWRVGHKPGTGRNGAVNDVAIAWPPGRSPILAAVYISEGSAGSEARAAAHRAIARLISEKLSR
jgi:beta-lactamase class A